MSAQQIVADREQLDLAITASMQGDREVMRRCMQRMSPGGLRMVEMVSQDLHRLSGEQFTERTSSIPSDSRAIRRGLAEIFDGGCQ